MKKTWVNPQLNNLSSRFTNEEATTLDLGHGYDEYNHVHFCSCGAEFYRWSEAKAHEKEMTLAGKSRYHMIGCEIVQS